MSNVFECETCKNADTITSTPQTSIGYECHRCRMGFWHDYFPEEKYDFDLHGPALNKSNNLEIGPLFTSFS